MLRSYASEEDFYAYSLLLSHGCYVLCRFFGLRGTKPGCISDGSAQAGQGVRNLCSPEEHFRQSNIANTSPQPAGALTLQQALAAGLMHSPELASFSWDVRAAEARELQAGLLPNPELSTEVENFGGNNEMQGFKSAETTVQISQLFETGGKRGYRKRTAELEKNLAGWEYEIKRLDVFEKISTSFWEVLAAQEREAIAESLFKLAEQCLFVCCGTGCRREGSAG